MSEPAGTTSFSPIVAQPATLIAVLLIAPFAAISATEPVGAADAGHEAEAIDDLTAGREVVAGAQAVDDRLRAQLVAAVAHHA